MDRLSSSTFLQRLPETEVMPVLFVGHGSPMNAVEDNDFSRTWREIGRSLPRPHAILCVSAHWQTDGTWVTSMTKPRTIHDFYGFPDVLFRQQYSAPGSPDGARATREIVRSAEVGLDESWGLDHGCWSIMMRLFPDADIPTYQLSLDVTMNPEAHYRLASELLILRSRGILIIGSGNIVHNLRMMDWNRPGGYEWAQDFDSKVREFMLQGDHRALIGYSKLGQAAALSIPTNEHYLPCLYALALRNERDALGFFNEQTIMGSISMRSFVIRSDTPY